MSKRFLIILLLITGIICGNALAKIDPATVTTGHVYLLDNVSGNQVPDDSANNNTGTIVGNPQVVDGLSGKALQFDGVDDGVNIPDSQYINVTSGPWQNRTIVAVFNCADVTKQQKQVVFEEGGRTRGLVIYVFDGQVYVGGWNRAEYNWNGAWLSTAINSNEWHAVALVIRDGTDAVEDNKFEMWMDGNLIDRAPGGQIYNHGNDNAIGYTNQNVVFHDDDGSGDNRDWFGGIVDEVWILNDALTASELSEIGPKPTKAKSPVPANDAIDIPRDVTLAWAPGKFANTHDVYFGTVFDDVNDASRTNPLDVLASQDQSATTYDPAGLLEFGQTYYWRVDEVNGPPDFTVYPGDVWQFTAEPLAYPIAGTSITATASSQFNENTKPENTINGSGLDADDLHSTEETAIWLSGVGAPQPSWIQYEFDRVYKLHQMWVWNFNQVIESTIGFGVKDATIEYSSDGVTWATLGTTHEFARAPGLPGYAHNTTIDFGGVTAQYVKITANSNWGGIIPQYGLSEIRFFYIPIFAREPDPASGATDMAVDNVTLSWRAGREAASHDVYLSTNEQAVIDETISPVSVPADRSYTSHDTGELELGQTYYWKINEVNEAETPTTWQGDVWDFGTLAYLVVDDFEDYNDFEPDRIF
ncbi:MAG: discoidin domain-containing protein, partial [Sedimentisphaerales bacterium]